MMVKKHGFFFILCRLNYWIKLVSNIQQMKIVGLFIMDVAISKWIVVYLDGYVFFYSVWYCSHKFYSQSFDSILDSKRVNYKHDYNLTKRVWMKYVWIKTLCVPNF